MEIGDGRGEPVKFGFGHLEVLRRGSGDFPPPLHHEARPGRKELELPYEVVGHVEVARRDVQLRIESARGRPFVQRFVSA